MVYKEYQVREYQVWPLPVRLFHWINLLLVLVMTVLGVLMLVKDALGLTGTDARIGLKTAHVIVGYLFIANLVIRLAYGLFASGYGRLAKLFPGPTTLQALKSYRRALAEGDCPQYLGHSPKGQLAVGAMVALMLLIGISGLYRAGTDIYFPPFGSSIQQHLAKDGVNAADIKPYDNSLIDESKANALKPLKSLAGQVHVNGVYLLWLLAIIHIGAVIYTDARRQKGIISAMFSGKKRLSSPPVDQPTQ